MKYLLTTILFIIFINVAYASEPSLLYPSIEKILKKRIPPPGVCRFIIVRHGQSQSNAAQSLDGRTLDTDLSVKGQEQAWQTGQLLALHVDAIAAVYSSPMKRALQTEQMIEKAFKNLPTLECDDRLLEKNYGPLEGASLEQYAPYRKLEQETIPTLPNFEAKFSYKTLEGMESMAEVYARILSFLQDRSKSHMGKTVLITTHNGILKALVMADAYYRKGKDLEYHQFEVANGSFILVDFDGNSATVEAIHGLKFH